MMRGNRRLHPQWLRFIARKNFEPFPGGGDDPSARPAASPPVSPLTTNSLIVQVTSVSLAPGLLVWAEAAGPSMVRAADDRP